MHVYQIGDQVLLNRDVIQRKLLPKRDGPYRIQKVYSNSLVKLQLDNVTQKVSVRRVVPYNLH